MKGFYNPLSPAPEKINFLGLETTGYENDLITGDLYMGMYYNWDETSDQYEWNLNNLKSTEFELKAHIAGAFTRQLLIKSRFQQHILHPDRLADMGGHSTVGFKWRISGPINDLIVKLAAYSEKFMDQKIELKVQVKEDRIFINRKEDVERNNCIQPPKKEKWINKLLK